MKPRLRLREVEMIDMQISLFLMIIISISGQPSPRFRVEAWLSFRNCEMHYWKYQENMRGQRGTLPAMGL